MALCRHPCQMGTTNVPATRTDVDQFADTRREIKELSDASTHRHRLRYGTPEYDAALETEERLVSRIWRRLRSDGHPVSPPSPGD